MSRNKIFLILSLALILRVIGLDFGLPYPTHQDEPIVVNHAMAIGAEGWNTRTYLPPQFASYYLFFFYAAYFVILKTVGGVTGAADFALKFLSDPTEFYLIGRWVLGVIPGVAAVWLLIRLCGRFFSEKSAFWSGLFLAACLLHSQHSHYIYMDIVLSFSCLLLFYLCLGALERYSVGRLWAIGLAFGWCVAVKYTAVYFFPVVAVSIYFSRASHKIRDLIAIGMISVATYAAISPFSFLDWPNFISQVAGQSQVRGYQGVGHHLMYSLRYGTGVLFLLLSAVGVGVCRVYGKKIAVIALAIVVYFGVSIFFSQPFPRYMMPILPLICLFAGLGAEFLQSRHRIKVISALFLLAVTAELLAPTIYSDYLMTKKDTRAEMLEWIHVNVKPGAVIAVDHRFFGAPLLQSIEQILEKYAFLSDSEKGSAREKRLDLSLKVVEGKPTYNVYVIRSTDDVSDAYLFYRPTVAPDAESVLETGAEYLLLNYAEIDARKHALKETLPGLELVESVSPYWDVSKRKVEDRFAATAAPHQWLDLFSRKRLGPYLELYRIKK